MASERLRDLYHLQARPMLRRIVRGTSGFVGSRFTVKRLKNDAYDYETSRVMKRVLSPQSNCVDVGAHRGTIFQEMLRRAPQGRHIAFEPIPTLASELRRRFPRSDVREIALSDRRGVASFQVVSNALSYSGLKRRVIRELEPSFESIDVTVSTLDDELDEGFSMDFLKLDIEGGEYHALRGGVRSITRSNPVIVLEGGSDSTGVYGVSADALYDLFESNFDYDLSTMRRWLRGSPPLTRDDFTVTWSKGTDYVFIATPKSPGEEDRSAL